MNARKSTWSHNPTLTAHPTPTHAHMHMHTCACACACTQPLTPSWRAGEDTKRRWLAYDERGGINTRADEGFNAVEVVLHDTSLARRRPPLLNDFYGFSLGALGEKVGTGDGPA